MDDDCVKGKYMCSYRHIVPTKDVNGTKFYEYYCACEDEMCAGCIPRYHRIVHHGSEQIIFECGEENLNKTDEELYQAHIEWKAEYEEEKRQRAKRKEEGTLTELDWFFGVLDDSPRREEIILFCPNCEATYCTVVNDKYICKMCHTEMQEKKV